VSSGLCLCCAAQSDHQSPAHAGKQKKGKGAASIVSIPLTGIEVSMLTGSLCVLRCRQGQGRGIGDVQSPAGGVQGGGQHVPDGQDAPLLQSWRAGPPGRHLGPHPKVQFTLLSSDLLVCHAQCIGCAAFSFSGSTKRAYVQGRPNCPTRM